MRNGLWNHNIEYHKMILNAIPPGCRALDVGCGQGLLARQLAAHCVSVTAIDLDHRVISQAAAVDSKTAVEFVAGDVMTYPFCDGSFNLIAAVATLHHLELRPALMRFRRLLAPSGILAIVGLYRAASFNDYVIAAPAFPVSWILRAFRGYLDVAAPVRDPRETLREIRSAAGAILPGAQIRRRLFFRYSLFWRKESEIPGSL